MEGKLTVEMTSQKQKMTPITSKLLIVQLETVGLIVLKLEILYHSQEDAQMNLVVHPSFMKTVK